MADNVLRTEIFQLTASISQQQKILDELHARLKVLQSQLDSIVYPILTLPPEITAEIFDHCSLAEDEVYDIDFKQAPFVLTRVCSIWRRIAISTPALWTRFPITLDFHSTTILTEMMESWLERAALCALSIKIRGVMFDASKLDMFLTTFQRHSPRVKRLELHLHSKFMNQMNARISSSDLPLLQTLVLGIEGDYMQLRTTTMFSQIPLLSSLKLCLAAPSIVTLPWHQLTEFTGGSYFDDECMDVLQLMPNLKSCRVEIFDTHDEVDLHHILHQNLEHLELVEEIETDIIQHVTLPSLQSFHWATTRIDTNKLDSVLKRSSPRLKQLVIKPRPPGVADFACLELSAFTGLLLTDVEIWRIDPSFAASFIRLLGSDLSFLPHLTKIRFMDSEDHDNGVGISDMLEIVGSPLHDRWLASSTGQCAPLAEFCTTLTSKVSLVEVSARLGSEATLFKKLKEHGVDLHIGSPSHSFI